MRTRGVLIALGWLLLGCGEELVEPGRMRLTSGHEPDPWTLSPAAVRATLEKESASGGLTALGELALPVSSFGLGEGAAGRFVLTGFDAADLPRLRARSLLVDPAGLAGSSLPLFVSRSGELGRPPGELSTDLGKWPVATTIATRHLLVARGAPTGLVLDGYDFAAWRPIAPPPALDCGRASCEPRTLAVSQGSLVLALGDGWGFWFDPIVGDSSPIDEPQGLTSFALVAGGAAVEAPDGAVYVVGGTRLDSPSASVLAIAADGTLSHLALTTARQGAAATWIEGRGLLVLGGGDTTVAGAELLADGSKAFVPLPQAPDESRGAAVVALDSTRILRVGGRVGSDPAPTVELSLGCAASCSPTNAGEVVPLSPAAAFALPGGGTLVVGDDASGTTGVIRWQAGASVAVPLREPRSGATALWMPTGHVGVIGGGPRTIELYVD